MGSVKSDILGTNDALLEKNKEIKLICNFYIENKCAELEGELIENLELTASFNLFLISR